jgi:outer membrane lipoprotein SlyB
MNAAVMAMGDSASNAIPSPVATKPLWAAIGILGVCVLAMGASLIHINKHPAEPRALGLMAPVSAPAQPQPNAVSNINNPNMITETADDKFDPKSDAKPAVAQKKPAQAAPKTIAKPTAKTAPAAQNSNAQTGDARVASNTPAPQPVAAAAPVKAVCANCGTVEAVTPVVREGKGSGVGIVAGGVVGAVLGNQVGQGNGRTAATVLGAVGGGWAGNKIEKQVKKDTVYAVRVRMEDGSVRNMQQATAPSVGAQVTVDGNTLRASGGAVYAPAPEQRAARAPQPARFPQPDVNVY